MLRKNHRFTLAARPVGLPTAKDFAFEEHELASPAEGELVVKVRYISLDPAMRGWMNDARSYIPPIKLGELMRAAGVGEVVESRHPGFAVGDRVSGVFGVQEYVVSSGAGLAPVDPRVPLPVMLSALGMPGLTAYFGLLDVGRPVAGNTVVVSGAAGAVGSVVGQIAKIHGCRAVGIAGGAEKCRYLTELGFDAAIDYKATDVKAALREQCPKGIDVYFDNVGGPILDAVLGRLAPKARVVLCGVISSYLTGEHPGPSNYVNLLSRTASMQGFNALDMWDRFDEAFAALRQWEAQGLLVHRETIFDGIESCVDALNGLFTGANIGKMLVKV